MATEVSTFPGTRVRPSRAARLAGLGSVFGKSIRDGRRGALIATGFIGVMMMIGGAAMQAEWATLEARIGLARQMEALPGILIGMLGEPINLQELDGFLSWRFGNILPVFLGIWSVLAMSATLAVEARRGTLDLVASSPVSRRAIALEKALAHVTLVGIAMVGGAILTWLATIAFATLPGDEATLGAAFGHFALTAVLVLAAGMSAFAAAPLLGRGRAMAVGFVVLFGGFLINAYGSGAPVLEALTPLSIFSWTADHRPLADRWDWLPVVGVGALAAACTTLGAVAFDRRDIGITLGSGPIRLPSLPAGTGGPLRRELADRASGALGWGLGIGLYAFVISLSADAFAEVVGSQPQFQQMVDALYPGLDLAQPTGVIQLAFFGFGSLMIGLAAAGMVSGWAGAELERRLDVVLAAPLGRAAWALRSGAGMLLGIVLVAVLVGALIAVGVATQGGEVGPVVGGTVVLGLLGTAFGSIGLLVGGLVGARFAAVATGGVVIGSFLLELLGNALGLPDWVVELSLNAHLGQPLIGTYDPAGLIACGALTLGGLLLGAWGLTRRDIRS